MGSGSLFFVHPACFLDRNFPIPGIKPKSVISVMMIIAFIFGQMFCCIEGAMGFHCNRKATEQMSKRWFH